MTHSRHVYPLPTINSSSIIIAGSLGLADACLCTNMFYEFFASPHQPPIMFLCRSPKCGLPSSQLIVLLWNVWDRLLTHRWLWVLQFICISSLQTSRTITSDNNKHTSSQPIDESDGMKRKSQQALLSQTYSKNHYKTLEWMQVCTK